MEHTAEIAADLTEIKQELAEDGRNLKPHRKSACEKTRFTLKLKKVCYDKYQYFQRCIKFLIPKQYHLSYNNKAVGKNIKWGRGEGDGNFGEENVDFKTWGWGILSSLKGTLYQ